jgi:hypothetical protein
MQLDCRDRDLEQTVAAVEARTERELAAGNYGDAAVGAGLGFLGRFALIPSQVNQFVWGNSFNAGNDAISPYNQAVRTGHWANLDSAKSVAGWTQILGLGLANSLPVPSASTTTGRVVQAAVVGGGTTGALEATRQLGAYYGTWDEKVLDLSRTLAATTVGAAFGAALQSAGGPGGWLSQGFITTQSSAWTSRFPGVQVRKFGDYWAKRVDPNASPLMQKWGQQTINEQALALEKLRAAGRPAAQSRLFPSGRLVVEDVGTPLGYGYYARPDYWAARFKDSWAMGTALNDLRPGNYGAGFRPFDPALDRFTLGLGLAGGAALTGAILGGVSWAIDHHAPEKVPQAP